MKFDRSIFLRDYRGRFERPTTTQTNGLNFLLDQFENDDGFTILRQLAYVLSTVRGETGTYQPIKERRANPRRQPALFRQQQRYFPSGFMGRGFVQLTFRENYRNAGQKLAGITIQVPNRGGGTRAITIDANTFVNEPDLVMQPNVAYLILSRGMREGWFRRRPDRRPFKLSDFIKEGAPPDYLGARNIINGRARGDEKFAVFAEKFELILRASLIS